MSVAPAALDKATLGLHPLDQYAPLIGEATAERIFKKADRVRGAHVIHVNSTFYGGGVTEILTPLTLTMNALGIETGWRQIQGTPAFFNCTKKFHNALQGQSISFTDAEKAIYEKVVFENATRLHLAEADAVIVHDPQPLPLVGHFRERRGSWLLAVPHRSILAQPGGLALPAWFRRPIRRRSLLIAGIRSGSRCPAVVHHAGDQSVFGKEQ
jgi:trehalose synthase